MDDSAWKWIRAISSKKQVYLEWPHTQAPRSRALDFPSNRESFLSKKKDKKNRFKTKRLINERHVTFSSLHRQGLQNQVGSSSLPLYITFCYLFCYASSRFFSPVFFSEIYSDAANSWPYLGFGGVERVQRLVISSQYFRSMRIRQGESVSLLIRDFLLLNGGHLAAIFNCILFEPVSKTSWHREPRIFSFSFLHSGVRFAKEDFWWLR